MKESIIYYPYYELEKDSLIQAVDHDLNIKALLLIGDRVLIPPSHLHDTSLSNIIKLRKYSTDLISSGLLTTSIGENHRSLNEYFLQKKYEDGNWDSLKSEKAEDIIEIFSNVDSFRQRNRVRQSYFFFEYLNELILRNTNSDLLSERKTNSFRKELDKILDRKGFLISKFDFDNLISSLLKNRKLNKLQYKALRDFANSAYYYAGCIGNQSHIGHSTYFGEIEITKFDSSFEFGPIVYYDPSFLISVLKCCKLIRDHEDFKLLSYENILELRNHEGFKKFKKQYAKLSELCQNTIDNDLERNLIEKTIERKMKFYKWSISYSTFIATLGLLGSSNPYALTFYSLSLLENYLSQFRFSEKVFAHSVDKIRIKLVERLDPFTAFCLKLENIFKTK